MGSSETVAGQRNQRPQLFRPIRRITNDIPSINELVKGTIRHGGCEEWPRTDLHFKEEEEEGIHITLVTQCGSRIPNKLPDPLFLSYVPPLDEWEVSSIAL